MLQNKVYKFESFFKYGKKAILVGGELSNIVKWNLNYYKTDKANILSSRIRK